MKTRIVPFCTFIFIFVTTLCSRASARDTLTLSSPLVDADGATLISNGGRFALGFFSPVGSSNRYIGIWHHNINDNQTVVWVANRKHAITGRSGRLSLTTGGGLTVADGNSAVVWSFQSATVLKNPVAQLLDSGNFVVSNGSSVAWQSFEFPTDTYIPGMKIGWDLMTGRNYNLTAWTSESDPAPSGYTMSIDQSGDPQLVVTDGPRLHWRGGPWNGNRFIGIEGMRRDPAIGIGYNYVTNPHQLFFSYLIDTSIIDRLVINTSGTAQHYIWIEDRHMWSLVGLGPRDECDSVARCGPNGVCHPDGSTMCTCLPGFTSQNNSVEMEGCVRLTALDCVNGTDGFVTQSSVKLPDTSTATVDWSMVSLDECRVRCLRNCSCTGYAQANISSSGNGCVLWWTTNLLDIKFYEGGTGQDLFVRVAAADLPSTGAKPGHRSPVIAVIVVPALAILLLAFIVYWTCWRKKKHGIYFDDETQEEDLDLPIYDLDTIAEATNNFSESNKLGQGGYGPVYKGKLKDGQEIAVKRLSMTSTQGAHEFKNEVMVIVKLQHRNLVRLLGCCIEARERMLIYEFMLNGSLDALLFDANETVVTLILQADKAKSGLLDWKTRYNIIVGIARGLLYLHYDSRLRIIHRDMKASNILLDKDMNPKISDFGMARTFRGDDAEVNTMRVVGTYGYMSPEYAMNGTFSVKSDVFSFGILILEIVSGRRNRGVHNSPFHMNLLDNVWNLWKDGEALKFVDESIVHSFVASEVLSCIKCGLLCVQERPIDRPTINTVFKMLDTDVSLLPEPSPPRFVNLRGPMESESSTTNKSYLAMNTVSDTILEGR